MFRNSPFYTVMRDPDLSFWQNKPLKGPDSDAEVTVPEDT